MKVMLLITIIGMSCSCNGSKNIFRNFYYVEPFKEQEIKLQFKKDSAFIFHDLTGCNQFVFAGKYRARNDSLGIYFIFDSVINRSVTSNFTPEFIFQ
ncbi:MAG: hypothetical protein IPP99_04090 [Chitinophagaceae bacterium]|nr:hypothetical protein [Chitinophagaceae bacterium]